jgi:hypothetical protein
MFRTDLSAFRRKKRLTSRIRDGTPVVWATSVRRLLLIALAGSLLVAAAAACNPTFAPPIRAVQYGAPARLTEGRVEIGAVAGGFAIPDVLSPHVGVGIRDWVALEVGGNFWVESSRRYMWAMGFIGPRFSYAPHRERRVHLISDLELGVGVGRGGSLYGNDGPSRECTDCDNLTALDRTAGGGYGGFGIGAQIGWLSLYGRARVEVSAADNVPTTTWPTASVGAEFNIHKRVALTLAFGYLGYMNARDVENGWFYQMGVTFFIDAATPHREATPPAPTTPPRPVVAPPPPPTYVPPPIYAPPPPCNCDDDEPRPDDGDESDP